MHRGELDIITRHPHWQFFGTCTFRKEPTLPAGIRRMMGLFFRTAKLGEVRFPQVVWALRPELGEMTGRAHFHYLLTVPGLSSSIGSSLRNSRKS